MRLLILTQSDPFYLAKNIEYLISLIPNEHQVIGCVLFEVSPTGKRKGILVQAKETFQIFGFSFFVHYAIEYAFSLLNSSRKVSKVLKRHGIPIIRLKNSINSEESLSIIKSYNPDLMVSIAGNQIFKTPLLELAPKGCINLHTALLPKYRGLMPSFWVLKNNEPETGVSVFFVDEGIDSGPIIVQKHIPISPEMTQKQLITISKRLGMDAIAEAICIIDSGNCTVIPNDDSQKTYYSYPTKDDIKDFLKTRHRFF